MYRHISLGPILLFIYGALAPGMSHSEHLSPLSITLRTHVSDKTILGKDAPEAFTEYAVSANLGLPWESYSVSGWGLGSQVMASAGILRGAGESAFVVSLIPGLALGSEDKKFALDVGAGGALLSRQHFGTQDYGGPFQFAVTLGVSMPLYKNLGLGYRYMHYSDAAVYGSDTTGADLHMVEFRYRL